MDHIKITDLSVGDWVIYNEEYYQILNVGAMCYVAGKGLEFRHYCTLTRGMDIQDDIDINKISPIPITPEILEKNGFVEILGRWYNSEYFMELEPNRGAWDRTINSGEYSVYTIKYVHQLQHALRLAGGDKEITL